MDEDFVRELFASVGEVRICRMFGGYGIYVDGLIIALHLQDELMLKGDAYSEAAFPAAGSRHWTYQRPGRSPVAMPYYTLPSEAYDDPDAMALWARRAFEAACHAPRRIVRRRSRSA